MDLRAVFKMAIGNNIGFEVRERCLYREKMFGYAYGNFYHRKRKIGLTADMKLLGKTVSIESMR